MRKAPPSELWFKNKTAKILSGTAKIIFPEEVKILWEIPEKGITKAK